jgi:hypothetical protein
MLAEKGGVLFLDISLRTGWCYGTLANLTDGPGWGIWQLPTLDSLGRRIVAFENALADAIHQFQPAVVGIEAPLPAGATGSAHTAELLICLAGAAEAVTYRWSRQFRRRAVSTLRSQVCGRFRVTDAEHDDRIGIKEAVVQPWIEAMGWKITENNAADAAVGWAFEMGVRAERAKPQRVRSLFA